MCEKLFQMLILSHFIPPRTIVTRLFFLCLFLILSTLCVSTLPHTMWLFFNLLSFVVHLLQNPRTLYKTKLGKEEPGANQVGSTRNIQ